MAAVRACSIVSLTFPARAEGASPNSVGLLRLECHMTDDSEPMRVPEEQAGPQSEPEDVSLNLPAIRRPRLAERIAMARRAMPPEDGGAISEEVQPLAEVAAPAAEVAAAPAEPVPVGLNEVQAVAPEILARYLLPPEDVEAADIAAMAEPTASHLPEFVAPDADAPPLTLAELFAEVFETAPDPAPAEMAAPIVDEFTATEVAAVADAHADGQTEAIAEALPEEAVPEAVAAAEPEPVFEDVAFEPERPAFTPVVFEEQSEPGDADPEPVSAAAAELVSLMDAQRTLLAEMMRLRTEGASIAPVPEPLPMLPLTDIVEADFDDEPPPMVLERAQAIHLAGGRALGRPLHEAPSRLPAFAVGMLMAAATAAAVYAWRVLG